MTVKCSCKGHYNQQIPLGTAASCLGCNMPAGADHHGHVTKSERVNKIGQEKRSACETLSVGYEAMWRTEQSQPERDAAVPSEISS